MPQFITLEFPDQWEELKKSSEPVIIFKHSSTCGISMHAESRVVSGFTSGEITQDIYQLIVQQSRPLSNQIAEETGITHQSPQVIILKDGKVIYDASHQAILPGAIAKALQTT